MDKNEKITTYHEAVNKAQEATRKAVELIGRHKLDEALDALCDAGDYILFARPIQSRGYTDA